MPQEIIIEVGEDASVTVESKGVVGQGCAALTKAIEQAIGTTTADLKKPEYHAAVSQAQQAKAGR